jgi:hypothetical protein
MSILIGIVKKKITNAAIPRNTHLIIEYIFFFFESVHFFVKDFNNNSFLLLNIIIVSEKPA